MKVKVHRFELPLRHTFRISRSASNKQETIVVELEEDGLKGYGESTTNSYYNATAKDMHETIMSAKLPSKLDHPADLWESLNGHFNGNKFAQNALDAAAYDLWGKKNNKPTYQLLNLDLNTCPKSDYTIGIDNIPKMIEKLKEFHDWPIFKIKLGSKEDDMQIIRELRKVTDTVFRVDANCGWNTEETIKFSHILKDLNVEFIEQPMIADKYDEMRIVMKESALPLIADESCVVEEDVEKCIDTFHGINIKLTKCGGITPALRMIEKARKAGKSIMAGCMTESTVGISAIAVILPLLDYVDMDGAVLLGEDIADGVKVIKGIANYPQTHGSGITLEKENHYQPNDI